MKPSLDFHLAHSLPYYNRDLTCTIDDCRRDIVTISAMDDSIYKVFIMIIY